MNEKRNNINRYNSRACSWARVAALMAAVFCCWRRTSFKLEPVRRTVSPWRAQRASNLTKASSGDVCCVISASRKSYKNWQPKINDLVAIIHSGRFYRSIFDLFIYHHKYLCYSSKLTNILKPSKPIHLSDLSFCCFFFLSLMNVFIFKSPISKTFQFFQKSNFFFTQFIFQILEIS